MLDPHQRFVEVPEAEEDSLAARTAFLMLLVLPLAGPAPASEGEPQPEFSFVLLADPHITGRAESDRRLRAAVRWVNEHRKERGIELVFVLGDVAWRRGQAVRAREMLAKLEVPWCPVIGDNEIQTGFDREFHEAFSVQHRRLAETVPGFRKAPTPVKDPATGRISYLQNFRFDHGGVRFVGLDWVTRAGGDSADLHDYPGGTWKWFTESVEAAPPGPNERVVLLSHLPMHRNIVYEVFSKEEYRRVSAFTEKHRDVIWADFAGHYHFDWWEPKAGYQLFVCDATWDDTNTVRLVSVFRGEEEFTYRQEKVAVEP
jgi:hypothetical protein